MKEQLPEKLTDDVEAIYDAAEVGEHGCLLPVLDEPKEDRGCDGFED